MERRMSRNVTECWLLFPRHHLRLRWWAIGLIPALGSARILRNRAEPWGGSRIFKNPEETWGVRKNHQ